MDTVEGNTELARTVMDDYLAQTGRLLEELRAELAGQTPSATRLDELTHTLKGSSAAVSACQLAHTAARMNTAAREGDLIALEAARTEFCLDFVTLTSIVQNWKTSL